MDAVEETTAGSGVNVFSRLLARLDGIHLVVTCRPDARVLADFGAPGTRWIWSRTRRLAIRMSVSTSAIACEAGAPKQRWTCSVTGLPVRLPATSFTRSS